MNSKFTVRNVVLSSQFWILILIAMAVVWASWPALCEMSARWSSDPRYSHGWLVPGFALYLLWDRRAMLASGLGGPNWWGLALIGVGEASKLGGARYYIGWLESLSLLPELAGIALLAGGWGALRWAAPAIGFLFFMIPLPFRIEVALGQPLQRFAALASNYALQTLGMPAVAEGNVIHLNHATIGVVEACNGLGMLVAFFAYAVGAALVLRRDLLDKVLIILSAIPIALMANITRITVTGVLHETADSEWAETVYHDLAGWLMMPLALTVLWIELLLLDRLWVDTKPSISPLVTSHPIDSMKA